MIAFPADAKVWIAGGVTDMRCGMNSLALKVQQGLGGVMRTAGRFSASVVGAAIWSRSCGMTGLAGQLPLAEGSGRGDAAVTSAIRSAVRGTGLATDDGASGGGTGCGGMTQADVLTLFCWAFLPGSGRRAMPQPFDMSRFPDLPPEVVTAFAAMQFELSVERAARQHEQAVVAEKEAFRDCQEFCA